MISHFAIIGGDRRSFELAKALAASYDVSAFALESFGAVEGANNCYELDRALSEAEAVIAPTPLLGDGVLLNTPFSKVELSFETLVGQLRSGVKLFAGVIKAPQRRLLESKGVVYVDVMEIEELAVLNAIPTAEGAIAAAMELMDITLCSSRALVLGFGRIGKLLSKMLHGIGAEVKCWARRRETLGYIEGYGYGSVCFNELDDALANADVIFNTVPALVLSKENMRLIRPDCVLIDLASKPGGIDFSEADRLSLKTKHALSLPGKVAPVTAALYMKRAILNTLEE